MKEIILSANAKINITLDVVGRRENGYHDVKMIMQSLEYADKVKVELAEKGIDLKCSVDYLPLDDKNLAYKAAKFFLEETGIKTGVKIFIEKNIPVAAGLAGGSTDAAAVLKALNVLTNANLSIEKLMEIGLMLGADVPYCILGKTALAEGLGEILTVLPPLKESIVCLAKPSYSVNTGQVYKEIDQKKNLLHPDTEGAIKAIEMGDNKLLGQRMYNCLEEVTGDKYSVIGKIKSIMYDHNSYGAMMSGSGPSVFGFFENMEDAQKAQKEIKKICEFCVITKTI
jgi:4-diphosphocytidyl-2-C-methyl-D-erythritol kinase